MKTKLKNSKSNNAGFAIVITLVLLPILVSIMYLVAGVVIVTGFKAEYKFVCIDESLKLQEKLLLLLSEANASNKSGIDHFNNLAKEGSLKISEKIKQIKSGVQFDNLNSIYPKIESDPKTIGQYKLAFNLDYTFIKKYHIECGVKLIKENNVWKSEIIY